MTAHKNITFTSPKSFTITKKARHIFITLIAADKFDAWFGKQTSDLAALTQENGFTGKSGDVLVCRDAKGFVDQFYACISRGFSPYDFAKTVGAIRGAFDDSALSECSFELKASGFKADEINNACIGWGLTNYAFDTYKKNTKPLLKLLWHKDADKKRVNAFLEASTLARNLINLPANDLGPDEMEAVCVQITKTYSAKLKTVKGAKLEKDFPLIHTVGKASPRAPRLMDITWGKAKDPMLTLVGKGVVFDTGGLDLKPSQYMRLMKKDMGGAAHALALGQMIMALKLPVRLRILIPCVENAVGGASFRPGDIITSRKGLTVENTNTDAEGRLILADALTLASEEKPDLIIDFATLTGSARAALGQDIPAMFSNNDALAANLQGVAMDLDDPVWAMPLWEKYKTLNESPIADLVNSAGTPGDLIYSALFLHAFLIDKPDWVHLDLFAWESNGRPGRTKGGTEMALRACLAMIEERYV